MSPKCRRFWFFLAVVTILTGTVVVIMDDRDLRTQLRIIHRYTMSIRLPVILSDGEVTPTTGETWWVAHWNNTNGETAIPHRFHQTYKDDKIPKEYHEFVQSWLKHHPDWEFYFWSDDDAEKMIKERYPQYWSMFESYQHRLQKSDAIRYFILHQYGGVYADMDVKSLKPIEPFLKSNTCIVVPEPFVQTKILFNFPFLITNAIMASVPNHPFITYLLEKLPGANQKVNASVDVLKSTGPYLLNSTYFDYMKKFPNCTAGRFCHVYQSDFKYLVPTYDMSNLKGYKTKCKNARFLKKFTYLQKQACSELLATKFNNTIPSVAYADHLWLHIGWKGKNMPKKVEHVTKLLPRVVRYRPNNV